MFSQERDFITGTIMDAKSGEPIVFANIHLENRNIGVISNLDGGFRIPLSYREMGDVLVISSMGYETKKLSIFDVKVLGMNLIRLNPALIELSEAVVKAKRKRKKLSAKKIVQKAIDALFENYPVSPYSKVGYYRDYQFDDGEYVNLNEAILEVFDQGFSAIDSSTTKVLLYDYQENTDFKRDTLARQPYDYDIKGGAKIINSGYLDAYGGNEFTILGIHNAIRNYSIDSYSFVHRFDEDLVQEHSFFKEKDSKIDEELLYTIEFNKKLLNHSAYGRLYISKFDYAIYQMEYAVYDDSKKNALGTLEKNGSKSKLIFEVNTSYRPKDGKMYLSYISFHNNFTLWNPPKLRLKFVEFKFDTKPVDQLRNGTYNDIYSKKRWIVLTFNTDVDIQSASKLKNYQAKFMGEQLKFDSLKVAGKKVTLYPRSKTALQKQMLNEIEILSKKSGLNEKNVQFKIKNVKDVNGNIINLWTSKNFNQFREFFVQQVKPNSFSPVDESFMKKDRPIFKDQPTSKPKNFNDYWMNTPLKTIEN